MDRATPDRPTTRPARPPLSWHRIWSWTRLHVLTRLLLIVMAAFFLSPLYWMVVTALKGNVELTLFPPTLWPRDVQWQNFVDAVQFIPFARYFANTMIIVVFGTIGSTLSSFVIAYGFSRLRWPGRDIAFYTVLGSIFIFIQFPVNPITMVPLFVLFAKIGWVNTFLPLIVPTFFGNPFYIFLLRQFLMQVPHEISEAARIDGASEFQIVRHIILPLARPALAVVALFAAFMLWNDFLGPLIYLQDQSKYTLSIGLTFYQSTHDTQWNLLMAASTLVVLPQLLVFFVFQRFFITGITLGSVK